uniref:MRG domain-containing protein n=1 Tax=Syphacia muris TaxID=451379 RepID=A0A0N5ABF6_9BILA
MSLSSEDSLSSMNSYDGVQWKPSKTYGFIHLLRFFVKLNCMAKSVSSFSFVLKWKRRSHQRLIDQLHHFLEFLNNFRDEFYDPNQDYIEASAEYLMKASEKAVL